MFKAIYRALVERLLRSDGAEQLILGILPHLRVYNENTIKGWQFRRGYALLAPGDWVLTRNSLSATAQLIPGPFSHAAMCVEKGSEWEISEMLAAGYTKSTFYDLCSESDHVVIMRCPSWGKTYTYQVIQKCRSFDKAKYDELFTLGIEKLYCSELIFQSDFERRLRLDMSDLAGLGRPYISPSGLFGCANATVIWDSAKEVR